MEKELKRSHKVFADGIIGGLQPLEAYCNAYPKAKKLSAQTKSAVLLKIVEIKDYIKQKSAKIESLAISKAVDELKDIKLTEVLTADRKKQILKEIAEGTLITEQFAPTGERGEDGKMGVALIGVSLPTLLERLKAIELHNKMTGDNEPDKVSSTIDFGNVIEVVFT